MFVVGNCFSFLASHDYTFFGAFSHQALPFWNSFGYGCLNDFHTIVNHDDPRHRHHHDNNHYHYFDNNNYHRRHNMLIVIILRKGE